MSDGRARRTAMIWWGVAAALLVTQLGVSVLAQQRARRASRTHVLLPMFTVAGQDLDRQLAGQGIYLEQELEAVGSDRFGRQLAGRLGRSAYLGPTVGPDDFLLGIHHLLTTDTAPLSEAQRAEVRGLAAELREVRAALADSEAEQRALVEQLQCARIRVVAELSPDQQRALSARIGPAPRGPR